MFIDRYLSVYFNDQCIKLDRLIDYNDSSLFRVKHIIYVGQALIIPSKHSFTFHLMDYDGNSNIFTIDTWNTKAIAAELAEFFNITPEEQ